MPRKLLLDEKKGEEKVGFGMRREMGESALRRVVGCRRDGNENNVVPIQNSVPILILYHVGMKLSESQESGHKDEGTTPDGLTA